MEGLRCPVKVQLNVAARESFFILGNSQRPGRRWRRGASGSIFYGFFVDIKQKDRIRVLLNLSRFSETIKVRHFTPCTPVRAAQLRQCHHQYPERDRHSMEVHRDLRDIPESVSLPCSVLRVDDLQIVHIDYLIASGHSYTTDICHRHL